MPKKPTASAIRSKRSLKKNISENSKSVYVNPALNIYDSSVQDTKEGSSGSTLVHFINDTWGKVGEKRLEIMIKDDKVKRESLFMVKFLDVGGGLCYGLCYLAIYHKVSAVSIKMSPRTFTGSLIHLGNARKVVSIYFFIDHS